MTLISLPPCVNRVFRNYSFKLIEEIENMKTNIFRYGTYGPWRQFVMLGTIYTEGSLACYLQQWYSQELLESATIGLYASSTSSDHWCRVHSKFPGMSAMVPAATVNLATRSSSVSTTVSCTRSPDLAYVDFFLWVHMTLLVYETAVETEDLIARITVAAGTIANMPGIFERTRQSVVAHSSSSCKCHCCN